MAHQDLGDNGHYEDDHRGPRSNVHVPIFTTARTSTCLTGLDSTTFLRIMTITQTTKPKVPCYTAISMALSTVLSTSLVGAPPHLHNVPNLATA